MKKQQMKEQKGQDKVTKFMKGMLAAFAFCFWFLSNGFNSYAANIGESAGTWVLDQIFWVGVVCLAIALATCLVKKAWVPALITAIGGGIILVFIKTPAMLETIGSSIVKAIGLG